MGTMAGRILRSTADVIDDPRAALRAGVARLLSAVRAWKVEEPQRVLPLRARPRIPKPRARETAPAATMPTAEEVITTPKNGDHDAE